MSDVTTDKGIARLAYQFVDSSKLIDFLKSFLAETDELYDSNVLLASERSLETAEGTQLDGIGEIVGITRNAGQTDDDYRLNIKAKIMINTTDMSVDSTLDLFQFVFGADRVEYRLPANLNPYYVIGGTITPEEEYIFSFFPTTLGIDVIYVSVPTIAESFSFAEDPTGKGYGDITDPTDGGYYVKIINP